MSKSVQERLSELQRTLKVGKGQVNKFGGYNYRSSEDILEAVKPLLEDDETITVDEEVFVLSTEREDRFYKKSVAIFTKGDHSISRSASAREDGSQKGMSGSQLSGSVGSYAKKYALGNLLAIDDTKDADATNDHGKSSAKSKPKEPKNQPEAKKVSAKDIPKEQKDFRNSVKSVKPNASEVKQGEDL